MCLDNGVHLVRCSGRTEINYIAQGMYGAAAGEPKIVSKAIVATWKLWEYGELPWQVSEDTWFWLDYGYEYYPRWLEEQKQK